MGAIRRVSDYDAATGLLSWAWALPAATAAADSYEQRPIFGPRSIRRRSSTTTSTKPSARRREASMSRWRTRRSVRAEVSCALRYRRGGAGRGEGVDVISKMQVRVSASSPDADTAVWRTLPPHLWGIDKGARVLTLTDAGRRQAGNAGGSPQARRGQGAVPAFERGVDDRRARRVHHRAGDGAGPARSAGLVGVRRGGPRTLGDSGADDARAAFPMLTNARRVG